MVSMVSKFTLLSSILLASLALALPSSLVEASVARGHEERRSRHINHVASRGDAASDLLYAPEKHWAGLFAHGRYFTGLASTITIPDIQPSPGSMIIWLDVDGFNCPSYIRLGFILGYNDDGSSLHKAVYKSNSEYKHIRNFPVNPGNEIVASIFLCSGNVVALSLHNNMHPGSKPFEHVLALNPGEKFCRTNMGWGLQVTEGNPLPRFHHVDFKSISWHNPNAPLSRMDIFNIQNANGMNITSVTLPDAHIRSMFSINNLQTYRDGNT